MNSLSLRFSFVNFEISMVSLNVGPSIVMVWYSPFSPQGSIPVFFASALKSLTEFLLSSRPSHSSVNHVVSPSK